MMMRKWAQFHRLPLKGEAWGRWSRPPRTGGRLHSFFIYKFHDVRKSQPVDSYLHIWTEVQGWFETVDGVLSPFQPMKCRFLSVWEEMWILTAALMCEPWRRLPGFSILFKDLGSLFEDSWNRFNEFWYHLRDLWPMGLSQGPFECP